MDFVLEEVRGEKGALLFDVNNSVIYIHYFGNSMYSLLMNGCSRGTCSTVYENYGLLKCSTL